MQEDFNKLAKELDTKQYRHDRARVVANQMHQQLPLRSDMHVLEFGCGTGLLGFNFISHVASLTFADTSEGMLAQVSEKIQKNGIQNAKTLLLDVKQTVLPQQYNAIVSLLVLHHVKDYEATIAMLVAHLTAGGRLGIADLDKEDGSFHQDVEVPHHGFERGQLRRLFLRYDLTNIQESTPYVMNKQIGKKIQEFPVFLLTAQKGE